MHGTVKFVIIFFMSSSLIFTPLACSLFLRFPFPSLTVQN